MRLLAVDLGTSSVKALVATADGRILGQGSASYPILRPQPEWAEQSPEEWWQATIVAVRAALEQAGDSRAGIVAIGLSGQMHGTVLLGAGKQLLAPAIIWPDRRSTRQVASITRSVGAERLINIAGSPLATGFQAATLRWLQEERPDLWSQTRQVLLPKDYLRWRLTGELATDPSDGSGTLLLDVRERQWSDTLLKVLDIEPSLLPPIQPSEAIAGSLTSGAAEAFGLRPGIPVATGAADTACSMLGAGLVGPDTLLLTLSSGGQLLLPATDVRVDPAGRIHTFCSALSPAADQPGWYLLAAILSAGLSLRWLRDQLFGLDESGAFEQMDAWAEATPAGAAGLLFLPFLTGERTPHMDPEARAVFLGLRASHGRPEMVRAVLEGVALACYDAFAALPTSDTPPEQIVLGGGGGRSPLWRQIMADVFQLPVRPLQIKEQAALGALLLAGAAVGLFAAGPTSGQWAGYGPVSEPVPERRALYAELLDIYRAAYEHHRQDFARLGRLPGAA